MRNRNLDALRGVAILLVLGRHLTYFPIWTKIGWAGVDLFFVLSGFLISGLLFREWQISGRLDLRRFYIRRGFKIYPAFYVLLFVSIAASLVAPGITTHAITLRSILAEALFVQNYFPGIWGQTWSLAVEEHFYIALPIVLWLLYRGRRADSDPFRALPSIFMAVSTIVIVLRIVSTCHMTTATDELLYLCPTHLRIDGLLFGVLLSYYRYFQRDKFSELARGRGSAMVMIVAAFLLLGVPLNNPIMHTVGFTLVFFGFGFLLARVIDAKPHRYVSVIAVGPLAGIGYYSYSIYLWHGWVFRLLPHATLPAFIGCLAAAIFLGIFMAKLVEYPMLALRDRWFPGTVRSSERIAVPARPDSCPQVQGIAPVEVAWSMSYDQRQ